MRPVAPQVIHYTRMFAAFMWLPGNNRRSTLPWL